MPIFQTERRSLLFLHVPKTGGSSIEQALRACPGVSEAPIPGGEAAPCPPQHLHYALVAERADPGAFDARIAVVRHPPPRRRDPVLVLADESRQR
ncbi:MAG: hypothetical protein AAFW46_18240, partial [Pseudomonadota bacterium]